MSLKNQSPKDGRMKRIRNKLWKIARDLHRIRSYTRRRVPKEYQQEFQQQIQRAFNAGVAYSEVQNIPQDFPVSEEGMLQIGPILREHIMESRKIYTEVDDLRGVVTDIFHKKTEEHIHRIMRERTEKPQSFS